MYYANNGQTTLSICKVSKLEKVEALPSIICDYYVIKPSSAGTVYRRQNMPSKNGPRTERIKIDP